MASPTETATLRYEQVPETTASLDWADLATLDLSKFSEPGGKEELAAQITRAIEDVGTFYHGVIFSMSQRAFKGTDVCDRLLLHYESRSHTRRH